MRAFTVAQIFLIGCISTCASGLAEPERLEEYHARGYEWPLKELKPGSEGWKSIFDRRFKQVQETIDDRTERYNAWMQAMSSAFLQPNFTESGWGLTKAPEHIVNELRKKLHDNVDTAPLEKDVDVIEGQEEASKPLFISNNEMNKRILKELKPMHEAWSGVELIGQIAYGLRVYRNGSRLLMHVDKSKTHIISCILHIDHSEDSEPWPIVIEDFQGNTNEVVLESGDMLFYESSKCFHGRPRTFKGSWYSSIFVHYYPKGWELNEKEAEVHFAVPPHWVNPPPEETDADKLVMVGTSMKEPDCEHVWCNLKDSVKWSGPAVPGLVISNTNRTIEWEPYQDETYHNEL